MKARQTGKPNELLRQQRVLRGWSLVRVADELRALCEQDHHVVPVNSNMIRKWEQGKHTPSPLYRDAFCRLYKLTADKLGFIDALVPLSSNEGQDQPINIPSDAAEPTIQSEDTSVVTTLSTIASPTLSTFQEDVTINNKATRQLSSSFGAFAVQESELRDMDRSRRLILQEILRGASFCFVLPPEELLSSDSWERLSMAITRSSGVDSTVLVDLEAITKSYWRLRANAASNDLLHGVLGHFQTSVQLMSKSQTDAVYQRLYSITGETAQVIGQILFDMHDYATAWSYYKFSIRAAQMVQNRDLEAVGLGRMSFLFTYSKQAKQTLPLLEEAQKLTQQSSATVIAPWLAAIEAEAYAILRDPDACTRALDRAECITSQGMLDSYATGFNPSRLAGYKGVCFLHLRQPELARSSLNKALELLNALAIRRQSRLYTDLATSYLQQEEVEEACKIAAQALRITAQTGSLSVLQRINGLRDELERWKDMQCVKDLNEQFATALMSITYRGKR